MYSLCLYTCSFVRYSHSIGMEWNEKKRTQKIDIMYIKCCYSKSTLLALCKLEKSISWATGTYVCVSAILCKFFSEIQFKIQLQLFPSSKLDTILKCILIHKYLQDQARLRSLILFSFILLKWHECSSFILSLKCVSFLICRI